MKDVWVLIRPRLLAVKNKKGGGRGRLLTFAAVGAALWGGLLVVCLRLLAYFQGIEELGDILAWKLLSMVMVVYFSLLVFSSILTALSKLYLSKDLPLVHSLPVDSYKIFLARWVESGVDSSWTIFVFALPVLISYGIVYDAHLLYYLLIPAVLLLLSTIASILSTVLVTLTVTVLPPGRIKSIFVFLGLALFLVLYLAFRMVRPERLVDPESFESFMGYLQVLQAPSSAWLPSTWSFDALRAALAADTSSLALNLALLATAAGALIFVSILVADRLYFKGLSRSQTARKTWRPSRSGNSSRLLSPLPGPVRAYVVKEIKTFVRDQTQWSQIFLILGLIVIYVFNFKVLPLERAPIETVHLQNILAFLNVGLASFVLTAVAGRFAYPAVSLEGEAFWIVLASPIRLKTFLRIKFFIYLVPLLVLTETLIVATNLLLEISPFMMGLSVTTVAFIVPAVTALGIGLGAAYADFNAENAAQAVTSFGGLVFMLLAAVYIATVIVLEAGPVYRILMASLHGHSAPLGIRLWSAGAFLLTALISILTVAGAMNFGHSRLLLNSRGASK